MEKNFDGEEWKNTKNQKGNQDYPFNALLQIGVAILFW